jgi:hypothetical protein
MKRTRRFRANPPPRPASRFTQPFPAALAAAIRKNCRAVAVLSFADASAVSAESGSH